MTPTNLKYGTPDRDFYALSGVSGFSEHLSDKYIWFQSLQSCEILCEGVKT